MVKLNNEIDQEVFEEGFVDTPENIEEKGVVPRVSPEEQGFVNTDLVAETPNISSVSDFIPELDLSFDASETDTNTPTEEVSVEETPIEETPIEETPIEEAPVVSEKEAPVVSEEEAQILPKPQSEIDQEGIWGKITKESRQVNPLSALGSAKFFGFKKDWGSSEFRRRSYDFKIGGSERDTIYAFENFVVPDLINNPEELTAKDVAILYRDAPDYIQTAYLDNDDWIETSGQLLVEDTGRTLESVFEGYNKKLLKSYLADKDRPWNKDNPDAFNDAFLEVIANDAAGYFNKQKIMENLPPINQLTDGALRYYFGVTNVQAFKDEGVPPYEVDTFTRMFDRQGNLRRFDPEIEDNIWTGVITERMQDVENWRDVGRVLKFGALAVPSLPHHLTSMGGYVLDTLFGEGTGHGLWEDFTETSFGRLAEEYDEWIGAPAAKAQADIILQGDLYHSKNLNNFVKLLASFRAIQLGSFHSPVIGTKARINKANEAVKSFRDPNVKVVGFAPGSVFEEALKANSKGWWAKLQVRRANKEYNLMSNLHNRGYESYMASVKSGMLYADFAAAAAVTGINYDGYKGTFFKEWLGEDWGSVVNVGTDLLTMILAARYVPAGIDRVFYNTEHTMKKGWWHVQNATTGGNKSSASYVKDVYGYSEAQMANMPPAQVNLIRNLAKPEINFINAYNKMLNDVAATDPDAAAALARFKEAETRMFNAIDLAIKENNKLLPPDQQYTQVDMENFVQQFMALQYYNDGARTLLNSMEEIEAIPWTGNVDFKVLTSKNAKHEALRVHAELNQKSLDMLRLILPPTGSEARDRGLNVLDQMNNFLIQQQIEIQESIQANERAMNILTEKIRKDSEHPEFPVDPDIANLPIVIDGYEFFDPIIVNAKRNLINEVESDTGINIDNLGDKTRKLLDSRLATEREIINKAYSEVRDEFKNEPINITDKEFIDIFEIIKARSGIQVGDESRFAGENILTTSAVVQTGEMIPQSVNKTIVQNIYNEGFKRLVQSHVDNPEGGQSELQEIYAKIYNLQGAEIPDIVMGKQKLRYDDPTIPKAVLAKEISALFRNPNNFTPVEGEGGLGTLITLDNLNTWRGEILEQSRSTSINSRNRKRLIQSAQDLSIVIDVITERKLNDLRGSGQSISDIETYSTVSKKFMENIVKPFYQSVGSSLFEKTNTGEFKVTKTNLMRQFFKGDDPVTSRESFDLLFPRRETESRKEAENILKAAIIRDVREGKQISDSYLTYFVEPILGMGFADKLKRSSGTFRVSYIEGEIQRAKDHFKNEITAAEKRMDVQGTFLENLAKVARSSPENPTAIWEAMTQSSVDTIEKTIANMIASKIPGDPFDPKYLEQYNQEVLNTRMDFGSIIADAFIQEVVNVTKTERLQSIGGLFDLDTKKGYKKYEDYMKKNNMTFGNLSDENIGDLARIRYYEDINSTAAAEFVKTYGDYFKLIDPTGRHQEIVSAVLGYDIMKQSIGKGEGAFLGRLQSTTLSSALAKVFAVLRGVVSLRWIGTDAAIRMNFKGNLMATAAIIQSPNVAARINEIINEGRYTAENMNWFANFVRQSLGLTSDYSNKEIIDTIMTELNVEEFEKMPETLQKQYDYIKN